MICSKCGKEIEQGAVFCPSCGTRTGEPVPAVFLKEEAKEEEAPQPESVQASEPTGTAPADERVTAPNIGGDSVSTVHYDRYPGAVVFEPRPEPVRAEPEKKKEFFGVGALVLCLLVIAVLSASTGVFAALYFTAVGAL